MRKFKYKIIQADTFVDEEELNAYGKMGWELVGFRKGDAWFKRPVEEI